MSRIERLFNLTAVLLDSSRPLTAEQIRDRIPGYDQPKQAAFRKMFERDKAALRELGVPIEIVAVPGEAEGVEGYTIPPEEYCLPDPGLTPDERVALGLALQAVRLETGPGGGDDTRFAELKLGLPQPDPEELPPAMAEVDVTDDRVAVLLSAIAARSPVEFDYTTASGVFGRRHLEPSAIANVSGHWYVAGRDRDREGQRLFRVDRIGGEIEVGKGGDFEVAERPDIPSLLAAGPWAFGSEKTEVEIRFVLEDEWRARRLFGEGATYETKGGALTVRLVAAEPSRLLDSLISFRERAVIVRPEEMREYMVEHLKAIS